MVAAESPSARTPHSGHSVTISITIRVRRNGRNAMKPRIQRVLTPWESGFMGFGAEDLGLPSQRNPGERLDGACRGDVLFPLLADQ
jgi:hypothetical protein